MKKFLGLKKSICLVTYYDMNYTQIGSICAKSIKKYAKIFGFNWKIFNYENNIERPSSWMRIPIIQKQFSKGYDYVFWIDSDALFVKYKINILSEAEKGKDLYLVKHNIDGFEVPNLGIFLIKNSRWSRKLLNDIWRMEKYIDHKWWENAAFLKLLGYDGLLEEGVNCKNENYLKKIKWLDLKWNSLPKFVFSSSPIINHYPALSLKDRFVCMKKDFEIKT